VQQALADALGVCETDVVLDASLQDNLGIEAEDVEDVAARLQAAFDVHLTPDEFFPDDAIEHMTVQTVVHAIERSLHSG